LIKLRENSLQATGSFSVSRINARVWSLKLPAPTIYFGHVYAYLIDTGAGLLLIDAGDASETGWAALQDAIGQAGFALADIAAILLTHAHYDHCGNAARLREASGAWIGMDAAEDQFLKEFPSDFVTRAKMRALCLAAGADMARLPLANADSPGVSVQPIEDARHVRPGEVLELGSARLLAISSRGHSPGHLCYLLEGENLLFAGDFVFPQGQPVILMLDAVALDATGALDDPLGEYLAALARPEFAPVSLTLPGHIGAFENLPARLVEERASFARRLDSLTATLQREPVSPAELAVRVRAGKGSEMTPAVYQFSVLNMITSLRALERRGAARAVAGAGGGLLYVAGG
jgi:glyoxylase-like metal-dependent hydrolase (beta-lactamase superfamily II)